MNNETQELMEAPDKNKKLMQLRAAHESRKQNIGCSYSALKEF